MNNSIQHFLSEIWLTSNETLIYMTCYKYPRSSVSSITRLVEIPRTTVFDSLQHLQSLWLLSQEKKWKGSLYAPTWVETIISLLESKKQSLQKKINSAESLKSEFEKLKVMDHSLTHITHYTWLSAIDLIYTKIQKASYVKAIFDPERSRQRTKVSIEDLVNVIKPFTFSSQEILVRSTDAKQYKKLMGRTKKHQTKLIDAHFEADQIITDIWFYFITFWQQIVCIEITNPIFIQTQEMIFDRIRESL